PFFARLQNLIPDSDTGCIIRRNINLEAVFPGVTRARDQNVLEAAYRPASHPVELHSSQIRVGQLLQEVNCPGTLDRDLREVIGQVLHLAVETAGVVPHPEEVFFPRSSVDYQQVLVSSQAMHDDIVDKRSLWIKEG